MDTVVFYDWTFDGDLATEDAYEYGLPVRAEVTIEQLEAAAPTNDEASVPAKGRYGVFGI